MRIEGYFSGWHQFEIEAENKEDSLIKGKEYCRNHPTYGIGGNFKLDSIECIKKLK